MDNLKPEISVEELVDAFNITARDSLTGRAINLLTLEKALATVVANLYLEHIVSYARECDVSARELALSGAPDFLSKLMEDIAKIITSERAREIYFLDAAPADGVAQ